MAGKISEWMSKKWGSISEALGAEILPPEAGVATLTEEQFNNRRLGTFTPKQPAPNTPTTSSVPLSDMPWMSPGSQPMSSPAPPPKRTSLRNGTFPPLLDDDCDHHEDFEVLHPPLPPVNPDVKFVNRVHSTNCPYNSRFIVVQPHPVEPFTTAQGTYMSKPWKAYPEGQVSPAAWGDTPEEAADNLRQQFGFGNPGLDELPHVILDGKKYAAGPRRELESSGASPRVERTLEL